jgi:hypothetical protein
MPLPKPNATDDEQRNGNDLREHSGLWNLRDWTINVSNDRDAQDEVEPANQFAFRRLRS